MTECCMTAKKPRKKAIHFLKDIFRDTTQRKENAFYTALPGEKNDTGREKLCSPHDVLPPFVRCPGLCTQNITRLPHPTVCTFAGTAGIFVQSFSSLYIFCFQGTTQFRQFCYPDWRGTQKTTACISGASHKNVRCALTALLL